MNIVGDFISRVDGLYPEDMDNEELGNLLTTIKNKGEEIEKLTKELEKAQKKLAKLEPKEKAPAKKACAKKTKKEE
jgi:alpha-amylase